MISHSSVGWLVQMIPDMCLTVGRLAGLAGALHWNEWLIPVWCGLLSSSGLDWAFSCIQGVRRWGLLSQEA